MSKIEMFRCRADLAITMAMSERRISSSAVVPLGSLMAMPMLRLSLIRSGWLLA